ncbi:MAG: M16 family metallopeptidase, partial [Desulfocapsaceae bacterium]
TASQLKEALSGSSVRYGFQVSDEAFVLSGQTVAAELELLFQVLQTILYDPGFRSSVYEISMKKFESMYRRLGGSIEGGARLYLDNFFSGGPSAAGLPSWERFAALEMNDVISWLKPYFQKAPLELNVVGDIDPDLVAELASKYFDPPSARSYVVHSTPNALFPVAQRKEVAVQSVIDKALVRYGWLTDDYHDIWRTRRLHVLAATLEERLRQKIREELGTSYSPSVYSVSSKIYPDYGAIYADVVVDRASVDTALAALDEIELSFTENPVDDDELVRARAPILTSLKDGLRTNGYWLHSVLSLSSRNQEQLVWPLSLIGDFSAINSTEINHLARRYIRPERRAVGIVRTAPGKGSQSVDQSADSAGVLPHYDG